MKKLFFVLLLIGIATGAEAVTNTHFVRDGGTGDCSTENNWSTACDTLPSTLQRGHTYYIADGSYGSYTFDDPVSSTQIITIKKATTSDHGTETGWSNAYGDGSADFTSWSFSTGYYDIDGQVGQWAPDLPNYQAYGITVKRTNNAEGQDLIFTGTSSVVGLIFRHIEGAHTNTSTWYAGCHLIAGNASSMSFYYCWFHDASNGVYNAYGRNVLFDHCVLERNGRCVASNNCIGDAAEHSEIAAIKTAGSTTFTIRYSHVRDWRSTGGIIGFNTTDTTMTAHGNIFSQTGYYNTTDGNGFWSDLSHDVSGMKSYFYNNTVANVDYGCSIFYGSGYTTKVAQNNIFYNCRRAAGDTYIAWNGGTHSYNWFYGSGTQSETGIQNGSGSPFVSEAGKNYHIGSGTTSGDTSIGATYNTDPDGSTRGADGTWDRGAYEYVGTTYTVTPSAGANGTISPNTPQTVASGATTQFTVTPSSGYTASVGGTCGGSLVGTTYTTSAITADCTVSATFADTTAPTVTISTSDPSSISTDSLSVAWSSSDGAGVTECRWRIGAQPNDSTGTIDSSSPATTTGYINGANTTYIGCRDAAGNWGYDSIVVNYTAPITPTLRGITIQGGVYR